MWWFRAESEAALQLDALACSTWVGAHQRENEVPSAALQRWLDRVPGRWLLVYDNAEGIDALRPHLPAGASTTYSLLDEPGANDVELNTSLPRCRAHVVSR